MASRYNLAVLTDEVGKQGSHTCLSCRPYVRKSPDDLEVLVLAHIGVGETDGVIASSLGLSIGAVRWAARSALEKLGAVNRPHAVARAIAMGYLDLDLDIDLPSPPDEGI